MHCDEFIRSIYRGSTEWPLAYFQTNIFDSLSKLIPFDLGVWGRSGELPESIVDVHLYHQSKREIEDCLADFQHEDFLADAVRSDSGQVINLADLLSHEANIKPAGYKEFARQWGAQQVLSTCWNETMPGLVCFMSLWRKSPHHFFTEVERKTLERLLPHIAEAHRLSRIGYMRQFDLPHTLQRSKQAVALCNSRGVLIEAEAAFFHLIKTEWSSWRSNKLPFELKPLQTQKQPYRGENISISAQVIDEMVLVQVRELNRLDMLGKKQLQIAQCYAHGENYHDISAKFSIAENTVRSHIATIFKKCSVHNKAELATLLFKTPQGAR
ncbi:helix-turn-helix transcriptional regulator [Sulfurirhabdus autotrophica]|uniref:Regulatory LuxR family protein n=1 Tax=Sulfurirhabdus autotrophica TaxID=1706046 RepID=A0A4R3YF88_9PROT|nr:helix-turn-helix transcriptional regulator [Sulfurirhabdus autotrophica]TCV90631.1 regulatory LuxR family protein [Sulfurirhabdus autotrophica]